METFFQIVFAEKYGRNTGTLEQILSTVKATDKAIRKGIGQIKSRIHNSRTE